MNGPHCLQWFEFIVMRFLVFRWQQNVFCIVSYIVLAIKLVVDVLMFRVWFWQLLDLADVILGNHIQTVKNLAVTNRKHEGR